MLMVRGQNAGDKVGDKKQHERCRPGRLARGQLQGLSGVEMEDPRRRW